MKRALIERSETARRHLEKPNCKNLPERFKGVILKPKVDVIFEDGKDARENNGVAKMKASNCSITWVLTEGNESSFLHEVTNNGFRQGITQKLKRTEKAQSFVCRRQILKRFLRLLTTMPECLIPKTLSYLKRNGDYVGRCDKIISHPKVEERHKDSSYARSDGLSVQSLNPTYHHLKRESLRYQQSAKVFLSHPPFSDWLKSPHHLQHFSLPWTCL